MPKVVLLGAGSGFTQPLFTDILHVPAFEEGTLGLVDIDAKRLNINLALVRKIVEKMGRKNIRVEAGTDRTTLLPGADYVINVIEVSGLKAVKYDYEIPMKYGIDQCIGDTTGPGGILKALRTVPVWLEILRDLERLCPHALLMNYTNPMSIMSLATVRSTAMQYVGLCHSVQGNSRHLADYAEVPYEQMRWRCGGINHMAWFTELTHEGEDLYPHILHRADTDPDFYARDPARFEMIREFGYYPTESNGHFSEYVPYFRKRKDLLKKYCREGYLGGSGFYAYNWPKWRKDTDKARKAMVAGTQEIPIGRGYEYAADIVEAHLTGEATTIHASVANTNLIPNLPLDGVVEVEVLVDRNGFTPCYFGPLPPACAALCDSNMRSFDLAVRAVTDKDRDAAVQALQLDPLSAAVCSLAEIRQMAEELFKANGALMPEFIRRRPAPRARPRKKPPKRRTQAKPRPTAVVSSMADRGMDDA